jgi:hypothetical protein
MLILNDLEGNWKLNSLEKARSPASSEEMYQVSSKTKVYCRGRRSSGTLDGVGA